LSYTNPSTFTSGATINPADLQNALDELQKYINGGISATDFSETGWAEARHIVRGVYEALPQRHRFVTGMVGGRIFTVDMEQFSLLGNGPTNRAGGATKTLKAWPNTGYDFYLAQESSVLISFTACPIAVPDGGVAAASNLASCTLFLDGSRLPYTRLLTQADEIPERDRHTWSSYHLELALSEGWHSISPRGYADGAMNFLTAWGISVEAWSV